MICAFTLDYGAGLTEEERDVLQPLLRGSPVLPLPESPGKYVFYPDMVGDLDAVSAALPRLVPYIRLKTVDLGVTTWEHITSALSRIEGKMWRVGPQDRALNERVNVHVPGLGLLLINKVDVLVDCCTEDLEKHLDDGWRILAVCPQPDQRRPDYVIGRHLDKEL